MASKIKAKKSQRSYFDIKQLFIQMGNIFKKKNSNNQNNSQQPLPLLAQIHQTKPRQRMQRQRIQQQINYVPVFKNISQNKMKAIQKSPIIYELINSCSWIIRPHIIEYFRVFNAFQYIDKTNALVLDVILYKSMLNILANSNEIKLIKQGKNNLSSIKNQNEKGRQIQEYSVIYSDLFSVQFVRLKKLKIVGMPFDNPEAIVSLQILPYIYMPCLEELHADNHNLTSLRFLKKCHWKNLSVLTLRNTKIVDSRQFSYILPYITNSIHIEILNLSSAYKQNWFEVSWICKMGFRDAKQQSQRLENDDNYYFKYNEKILRRVCNFGLIEEYSMHPFKNREKHMEMIRRKFNNKYLDNPLVLWM